jgi:hypothetical protein
MRSLIKIPASKASAALTPFRMLISSNTKKAGPNIMLKIKPVPTALKTSSCNGEIFIVDTKIMKPLSLKLKTTGYLKVLRWNIGFKSLRKAISNYNLTNIFRIYIYNSGKI